MARDGVDALVCVLPKNVYYLSDYDSDWLFDVPWAACAIVSRHSLDVAMLIVHDVEVTNLATSPSWIPNLRVYRANLCGEIVEHYAIDDDTMLLAEERGAVDLLDATRATATDGVYAAIQSALHDLQLDGKTLAIDDARLREAVAQSCPRARCVDGLSLLNEIRAVKSASEVRLMREAAARNQRALTHAVAAISPGASWADVCRAYEHALVDLDCRPFCFYVGAGRRSMGLRRERDYPIHAGDQVCFDSMITYERYFGDAQRTAVVGTPSDKLARYWTAVEKGASECYGAMAPGVDTATLRTLALNVVRSAGIPTFRHAFVHGLGLDHIELPVGAQGFGSFTLQPGMIVNMDLEVCEIGFGGVYFEESMLITQTGAERLYSMPRELIRVH